MDSNGNLIISIEDNIRLVGTAHVSKDSVELVKSEIEQWNPDIVAVELCESRFKALSENRRLDKESLLKVINSIDLSIGFLFMPAAISDYITDKIEGKINRRDGQFTVNLSPNVDIISLIVSKNPKLTTIGFSAQLNMDEDMTKIIQKGLDYLVINDISKEDTGFESDFNEITILDKDGNVKNIEKLNKFVIAKEIMNYVLR